LLAQLWRLEIAVADDHTNRAFRQVLSGSERLPIARCQLDLARHTGPADACMQTKAVEGQLGVLPLPMLAYYTLVA
jgi:hypothetical protein